MKIDDKKKQSNHKQYIKALFPSSFNRIEEFPSLSQCVGTKRLWSYRLGEAFWKDSGKIISKLPLENIAFLSRSYLVIDDFLKDENIDDRLYEIGSLWLKNIGTIIKREIIKAGGDPDEFDQQLRICENAFNERKLLIPENAIKNAINKCEIFFNPYKLKSIALKNEVRDKRIEFLENFFTVCQILDDFCDIEEDLNKEQNHNLFMTYLSQNYHNRVLPIRKIIAPSLLKSISDFLLKDLTVIVKDSNFVFRYFFDHSLRWLRWKITQFNIFGDYVVDNLDISNWEFNLTHVVKFEILKKKVSVIGEIGDIRPEFMQAYFNGAKSLSQF